MGLSCVQFIPPDWAIRDRSFRRKCERWFFRRAAEEWRPCKSAASPGRKLSCPGANGMPPNITMERALRLMSRSPFETNGEFSFEWEGLGRSPQGHYRGQLPRPCLLAAGKDDQDSHHEPTESPPTLCNSLQPGEAHRWPPQKRDTQSIAMVDGLRPYPNWQE